MTAAGPAVRRVTVRVVVVVSVAFRVGVPHDEQRPAGRHPGRQPAEQLLHGSGHVHVVGRDEVVPVLAGAPVGQVRADPVDAPRDLRPGVVCVVAGVVERRGGDVDGGDIPAARGEPERVGPAPATGVQRPAGVGETLTADAFGRTDAPGVWAAGNVTDPSAQVGASAAAGALAGAHINADLVTQETRRAVEARRAATASEPAPRLAQTAGAR